MKLFSGLFQTFLFVLCGFFLLGILSYESCTQGSSRRIVESENESLTKMNQTLSTQNDSLEYANQQWSDRYQTILAEKRELGKEAIRYAKLAEQAENTIEEKNNLIETRDNKIANLRGNITDLTDSLDNQKQQNQFLVESYNGVKFFMLEVQAENDALKNENKLLTSNLNNNCEYHDEVADIALVSYKQAQAYKRENTKLNVELAQSKAAPIKQPGTYLGLLLGMVLVFVVNLLRRERNNVNTTKPVNPRSGLKSILNKAAALFF